MSNEQTLVALCDSCHRCGVKRYLVRRTNHAAPQWSEADSLTDFAFAWEDRDAPQTGFRALHDDVNFHFRFNCNDTDLVLPDRATIKDRVLGSDRVEIFFAPDLSLRPYYGLEMSPRGDVLAYKGNFYREIDWDWTCAELQIEARIEGGHYTVSGSIPLETLRTLNILRSSEIHAGIYRAEFHHKADGAVHCGWMPWVNPQTELPDFHVPASFGTLELID